MISDSLSQAAFLKGYFRLAIHHSCILKYTKEKPQLMHYKVQGSEDNDLGKKNPQNVGGRLIIELMEFRVQQKGQNSTTGSKLMLWKWAAQL